MQHRTPPCHLTHPPQGDSSPISPQALHPTNIAFEHTSDYSDPQAALVHGAAQEVEHTASRRSGPRRWLRAVEWLIAAGLHGRANATTQRVAEDLAARMDYSTGHARYLLDEIVARTGISRASVKRHIGYLRELGALAWVQHGSRINIRRTMGLKGYAATATVYAAVIPPVFDHAMGHTIVGTGYQARIIVDLRNRQKPVDNPPVENPGTTGCEPPSLTVVKEESQVQLVGGFNYTSQATRDHASPTQSSKTNRSSNSGTGRHALQVAKDIRIARQVRPLVNWTQREGLRRLAFSLRPLIDCGLDAYAIAGYLHGLCSGLRWTPRAPASYIATVLADQDQQDRQQSQARDRYELENPVVGAFQASTQARMSVMAALDEGLKRYQHNARIQGLADLSYGETVTWDAAADMAAFLGSNA